MPGPIPTFETWDRENLVKFCTESNDVIKTQRELIQMLRQLLAGTHDKGNSDARKTD